MRSYRNVHLKAAGERESEVNGTCGERLVTTHSHLHANWRWTTGGRKGKEAPSGLWTKLSGQIKEAEILNPWSSKREKLSRANFSVASIAVKRLWEWLDSADMVGSTGQWVKKGTDHPFLWKRSPLKRAKSDLAVVGVTGARVPTAPTWLLSLPCSTQPHWQ